MTSSQLFQVNSSRSTLLLEVFRNTSPTFLCQWGLRSTSKVNCFVLLSLELPAEECCCCFAKSSTIGLTICCHVSNWKITLDSGDLCWKILVISFTLDCQRGSKVKGRRKDYICPSDVGVSTQKVTNWSMEAIKVFGVFRIDQTTVEDSKEGNSRIK
jgi:hypothetical protein